MVDAEYQAQRIVYALACFRAGAEEVEVLYQFLDAPDDVVSASFSQGDVAALERELGAAIARIREGEFTPTPSAYACAGCPALGRVCAGPALAGPWTARSRTTRRSSPTTTERRRRGGRGE